MKTKALGHLVTYFCLITAITFLYWFIYFELPRTNCYSMKDRCIDWFKRKIGNLFYLQTVNNNLEGSRKYCFDNATLNDIYIKHKMGKQNTLVIIVQHILAQNFNYKISSILQRLQDSDTWALKKKSQADFLLSLLKNCFNNLKNLSIRYTSVQLSTSYSTGYLYDI